jgi:Flp pilus assembly pilin Flp
MTAERPSNAGIALREVTGISFDDMHHLFSLIASGTTRPASQRGQSMVEYALILVLIAIVVIIVLITQGGAMVNLYSNIACGMKIGCS